MVSIIIIITTFIATITIHNYRDLYMRNKVIYIIYINCIVYTLYTLYLHSAAGVFNGGSLGYFISAIIVLVIGCMCAYILWQNERGDFVNVLQVLLIIY